MERVAFVSLAVIAVAAIAAYVAATIIVYDTLTDVSGGCPDRWAANSPTGFTIDGRPEFDTTPYVMPAPQEVSIASRDRGITVSGWWVPAADPQAPAVILVHGHKACKRDHAVLLPAGMLFRNGFSVLLVDLRDHGESTWEDGRHAGGTEEYRDVLGAWDWLQAERGVPREGIGLVGISLGAATVLIAFGEEPGIAAAWEDSSYADIRVAIHAELARNGYPEFLEWGGVLVARLVSGDDLATLSPLGAISRLNGRPLFITHGELDERLSVQYAHDLIAAVADAGNVSESWLVPDATHAGAMVRHPAEYERRLVEFFRKALPTT
jgi:uncharacterized protein